jgi:hypothetical protein
VLQPIQVVYRGERLVVRDGHRRSLASLIADQATLPAMLVEEPTELAAIAHPLIVNLQRQDLTAIEKGAALLRLALLVGRQLASETGEVDESAVTIEGLVGDGDGEDEKGEVQSTVTGLSRRLAAQVRERVCAMVGMKRDRYYNYLRLNRLAPEARATGRGLPEQHLQPIVPVPAHMQAEIVDFVRRYRLNARETQSLARVARNGDRDEVARIMARLQRAEPPRRRTSVSWEALLHAIPEDWAPRCAALRAEMRALSPEARAARIDAMRQQLPRLAAVAAVFEEMVDLFGPPAASRGGEPAAGRRSRR